MYIVEISAFFRLGPQVAEKIAEVAESKLLFNFFIYLISVQISTKYVLELSFGKI